jgi:hypothetical protein
VAVLDAAERFLAGGVEARTAGVAP